jgi:hypothetical protein
MLLFLALSGHTVMYRPGIRLTVEYARVPAVTAYLLLFVGVGFLPYCIDICRLCWRFAGVCGGPWLRRGLRITAVGSVFAVLYCIDKVLYLFGYWLGRHPPASARSPRCWSPSARWTFTRPCCATSSPGT